MSCPLCELSSNVILRTDLWTVVLCDDQGYLGRCYFALNRHETDVTNLSEQELLSLWSLFARVKDALDFIWQPDHYNYVFLMNVQPHLHGHIIPRYEASRTVGKYTFTDGQLGGHYSLDNVIVPDDTTLCSIADLIRVTVETVEERNI